MARQPKKRTAEPIKASTFLDALKFCSHATIKDGNANETHVLLNNNWAVVWNGVTAIGHPIDEDIRASPHNELMIAALSKCGENLSITQLDHNRLSIKSDKFKAIVPCLDPTLLENAVPDNPIAPIDDKFKEAAKAVGVLTSKENDNIIDASILMNGASLIATDRRVVLECWNGLDLPPNLPLPKSIIDPLTKTNKKLAQFGFSNSSVTFYFEDGSWVKSQLYAGQWPDVSKILDTPHNAWPVPVGFWDAISAVAPFSETGDVFFNSGMLRSHPSEAAGASYEVAGLPNGPIYSAKQLMLLKPHAKSIDFMAQGIHTSGYKLIFFGDRIRGAIAGRTQ